MARTHKVVKAFSEMLPVTYEDAPNLSGLKVYFLDKKTSEPVPSKVLGGGQGGSQRRRVQRKDGKVHRMHWSYLRFA